LFRQFESDRLASFPLADGGPIDGISIGRNVFDPQRNDIATAKLAVDCARLNIARSRVRPSN
jgi:hypothetical protein